MEIILKGIAAGLALALLIGPVFFTIIQTSMERGFLNGAWVAAGVSLSDTLYITLAYLGLSKIISGNHTQLYMAYIGGAILFCFGVYYLLIKSRRVLAFHTVNIKSSNPVRLVAKGFIINGLSPMVLIFWLGMVSVATGEFGYTSNSLALTFFGAIIATVFITDIIKAKLADRLRQIMTPRFIRVMNIVLGLVMVIFGGRLILFADQVKFI
jgi:threonine/homoserine/homoserine lactone efflux protein